MILSGLSNKTRKSSAGRKEMKCRSFQSFQYTKDSTRKIIFLFLIERYVCVFTFFFTVFFNKNTVFVLTQIKIVILSIFHFFK